MAIDSSKNPKPVPSKRPKSSRIQSSRVRRKVEAASAATVTRRPDMALPETVVEEGRMVHLGSSKPDTDATDATTRPGSAAVDASQVSTDQAKEDWMVADVVMATTAGGRGDSQTLVAQLEYLVEQAKRGVEAGERRALMLTAMELMKVAMDECSKDDV